MTIAELVALHRGCKMFMERNAVVMLRNRYAIRPTARRRSCKCCGSAMGILPRNLILVEVTHRKVPYIRTSLPGDGVRLRTETAAASSPSN